MDAGLPVRAFFTDRHDGVSEEPFQSLNLATHVGDDGSAVDTNRALVADRAGARVVFMRPDYGMVVARLDESYRDGREPPVADVLITTAKDVALAALGADCIPMLAHDALTGAVLAAHIGREGLRKGVVDAAVAALIDIRHTWTQPESVTFSIGPSICGKCYEVSSAVRAEVAERHPVARSSTSWATPSLDLARAVEARLGQLGFSRVLRQPRCTFEDAHVFSHRREGVTGRQAGVVVCEGRPS